MKYDVVAVSEDLLITRDERYGEEICEDLVLRLLQRLEEPLSPDPMLTALFPDSKYNVRGLLFHFSEQVLKEEFLKQLTSLTCMCETQAKSPTWGQHVYGQFIFPYGWRSCSSLEWSEFYIFIPLEPDPPWAHARSILEQTQTCLKMLIDPERKSKVAFYVAQKEEEERIRKESYSSEHPVHKRKKKEFLSSFPLGRWIRIDQTKQSYLCGLGEDDFSGCYAICSTTRRIIYYIGRGKDCCGRALQHPDILQTLKQEGEDVELCIRKDRSLFENLTLEARLISRIRPRFNVQYVDRKNSFSEVKESS